jgi:malonyl CoA-acyl carrier protein transacylase
MQPRLKKLLAGTARRQTGGMTVIGLLHTSDVHRPVFDDLVADIDSSSRTVTVVDEALLDRARRFGTADPTLTEALRARLLQLAGDGVGAIVCTCSTIGGLAESVGADLAVDVVRVDRAMAERAVAIGGTIAVLAALESTVAPTRELIESVARSRDVGVEIVSHLVAGAWDRFEAGDVADYHALVAATIGSIADEADVVVLAQASMAPSAEMVDVAVPILSSPRLAIAQVLR